MWSPKNVVTTFDPSVKRPMPGSFDIRVAAKFFGPFDAWVTWHLGQTSYSHSRVSSIYFMRYIFFNFENTHNFRFSPSIKHFRFKKIVIACRK